MKYSGIGGQAVMEGVMMKNKDTYAVAVRKSDGEIIVEKKEYKGIFGDSAFLKLPLVRGVVNFIDSLVLGMRSLTFSASFFEEEGEKKELSANEAAKAKKKLLWKIWAIFREDLTMNLPAISERGFREYMKKAEKSFVPRIIMRIFDCSLYTFRNKWKDLALGKHLV